MIKPIDGWPLDIVEEFRSRLTTTFLFAKFVNYNEIRDISEVEIAEKNSKTPLNKDFGKISNMSTNEMNLLLLRIIERYQSQRPTIRPTDKHLYKCMPNTTHYNRSSSFALFVAIPMEKLELNQSYQIRMLYYISPSHFYVYLKEKFNAHTSVNTNIEEISCLPLFSIRFH